MKRIGLYPGTFDPLTNGHLDIINRASRLVDELIVGVAKNEDKKPLFGLDERVEMVEACCKKIAPPSGTKISVRSFDGLLVHYAEEVGASIIIRGLRAVADFEYEFQMVGMNARLNPDIQLVFLMAGAAHQAIASRLVKEIARLGGDIGSFTTPEVAQRLLAKFGR